VAGGAEAQLLPEISIFFKVFSSGTPNGKPF
jgi:hypothetical protein